MAKPVKRRIEPTADLSDATSEDDLATKKPSGLTATGRTTPKGTKPGTTKPGTSKAAKSKADDGHSNGGRPAASTRYTPPTPATKYDMPSPIWVPILMFGFFGIGMLVIFLNYTGVLPGAVSQWYLLGGLGAILAGIITSTQLR